MICKNCGKNQSTNDRFCANCGAPLRNSMPAKQRNGNQTIVILLLVIVILTLMVIAGVIAYQTIMAAKQHSTATTEFFYEQPTAEGDTTDEVEISPADMEPVADEAVPLPEESVGIPEPVEMETYQIYANAEYGFTCAYPSSFLSVTPRGANGVEAFVSGDMTATMTLRASRNTGNLTVSDAYDDLCSVYGEDSITYHASGKTWYAVSIDLGDRLFYRKLFVKNGVICCMDFEFNEEDLERYSPYIEFIEDNFKLN